jgi:Protein of unknown function (DUF3341)
VSGGGDHGEGSGFVARRFVLAQFATAEGLLDGTRKVREGGHKNLDTHTPYPLHGLEEALGLGRPKIPTLVLLGAIAGACLAYSMIYYMNVFDWPINIANRPAHSPPTMLPITFELAVLLAGSSSFFGFFALAGLPKPYHPVFEAEMFVRASIDGFLLSVEVPTGGDVEKAVADVRAAGANETQVVTESER